MKDVFYIANKFRLCAITRLDIDLFRPQAEVSVEGTFKQACKKVDPKEGLAIECATDTGSYVVIAFIYPDKGEGSYYYKSVGDRIERYCDTVESLRDFRDCITVAKIEFNRMFRED
jgi:hypothetical protein